MIDLVVTLDSDPAANAARLANTSASLKANGGGVLRRNAGTWPVSGQWTLPPAKIWDRNPWSELDFINGGGIRCDWTQANQYDCFLDADLSLMTPRSFLDVMLDVDGKAADPINEPMAEIKLKVRPSGHGTTRGQGPKTALRLNNVSHPLVSLDAHGDNDMLGPGSVGLHLCGNSVDATIFARLYQFEKPFLFQGDCQGFTVLPGSKVIGAYFGAHLDPTTFSNGGLFVGVHFNVTTRAIFARAWKQAQIANCLFYKMGHENFIAVEAVEGSDAWSVDGNQTLVPSDTTGGADGFRFDSRCASVNANQFDHCNKAIWCGPNAEGIVGAKNIARVCAPPPWLNQGALNNVVELIEQHE